MYYKSLLKNSLYLIHGKLQVDEKLIATPWGEIDWQSGIERWKISYYALFKGYHHLETEIALRPEAINFIDKNSIRKSDNYFQFESLRIFQNNPYFSFEIIDNFVFGKEGLFANGQNKIIGEFSIIRLIKPSELVNWIDEI
ncbi:hypothetical protein A7P53_12625 [Acinetobacter defluvii]|uniref:hypothetical protein n=1 Tax=Acinetobacter defluvii TaxID=1871111 RepID=UPI00148F64AE|nr:hypothetical protein [Acinetobacter defluvii]NNP73403.1 hypothetical protein [Acinetobacter defluvii]